MAAHSKTGFDVITVAKEAYLFVWKERTYLQKLILVPLFIKFFCYLVYFLRGEPSDAIQYTLITLPSLFAEGWLLAHCVRLVVLGHRWPFRPSGVMSRDVPVLMERARGIMSATLVYVLTQMVIGAMLFLMPDFSSAEASSLPPAVAFLILVLMGAIVWAFPLAWLHIPLAVNFEAQRYFEGVRGVRRSFSFVGLWGVVLLPVFFIFSSIPQGARPDNFGWGALGVLLFLTVLIDTLKNILATVAITLAVRSIFRSKGKKGENRS